MSISIDDKLPHPIKRYADWFETLPRDVQATLALLILNASPDGVFRYSDANLGDMAQPLLERIRKNERSVEASAGLAICLRELTDWAFVPYATPEAWQEGEERLRQAHANISAQQGPHAAGDLDRLIQTRSFNSRMFVREYEQWTEFRNRFLSTSFLQAWSRVAQLYPTE